MTSPKALSEAKMCQSLELSHTFVRKSSETGTAVRFEHQIHEQSGSQKCETVIKSRVSSTTVLRFLHAAPKRPETLVNFRRVWRQFYVLGIPVSLRRRNDFWFKMSVLQYFRDLEVHRTQARDDFLSRGFGLYCKKQYERLFWSTERRQYFAPDLHDLRFTIQNVTFRQCDL